MSTHAVCLLVSIHACERCWPRVFPAFLVFLLHGADALPSPSLPPASLRLLLATIGGPLGWRWPFSCCSSVVVAFTCATIRAYLTHRLSPATLLFCWPSGLTLVPLLLCPLLYCSRLLATIRSFFLVLLAGAGPPALPPACCGCLPATLRAYVESSGPARLRYYCYCYCLLVFSLFFLFSFAFGLERPLEGIARRPARVGCFAPCYCTYSCLFAGAWTWFPFQPTFSPSNPCHVRLDALSSWHPLLASPSPDAPPHPPLLTYFLSATCLRFPTLPTRSAYCHTPCDALAASTPLEHFAECGQLQLWL